MADVGCRAERTIDIQGIDDALALIFAVADGLTLEGITIVLGNSADVKKLGTNAKCILRNAGYTTIYHYSCTFGCN